jgi:REP element-mobilizing transposase RayT
MIHAYHVIWGTYGFWLPNDPRGSWSNFVASWEVLRFGKTTRQFERNDIDIEQWAEWRRYAQSAMNYPAVNLNGEQARAAANGFGQCVRKSNFTVWACSVLPDHVHMIIARHTYKVEQICNLLKGQATRALVAVGLHPLALYKTEQGGTPSPWARGQWKVYLDSEEAVEAAIRYVEENPQKESKPLQKWKFVTPFGGLPKGGWITYH